MSTPGNNSLSSSPSPGSGSTGNSCNNNINSSSSTTTTATTNGTGNGIGIIGRDPEADAIKMFVGQIPREWNEDDCRMLFEAYGEIASLNILRDKQTGLSRGCCFITYHTRRQALEAQNSLHNIKTLPGMHHPIQMKPADSENRNERKLFIGMLSKKYNETDVRLMFSPYGNIEECSVLRDANGQSKGCAFVTYASRQCAINAIKAMNQSQKMEGCSSPLVVRFADTQKDKDAKKLQQQQQQLLMQHLAITNPAASLVAAATNPYVALAAAAVAANAQQQQQQQQQQQHHAQQQQQVAHQQQLAAATLALQQQLAAAAASTDQLTLAAAAAALASNPLMLASLCGSTATNGNQTATSVVQPSHLNGNNDLYALTAAPQGHLTNLNNFTGSTTLAQLAAAASLHHHHNNSVHGLHHSNSSSSIGKQIEGPDGANLFIYHLPPEFRDNDLAQTFLAFGQVISSKVFIDKRTNLSKCFGFVSYDNPLSAQAAIQAMNGFQIGTKRLKVQIKRCKDKPY